MFFWFHYGRVGWTTAVQRRSTDILREMAMDVAAGHKVTAWRGGCFMVGGRLKGRKGRNAVEPQPKSKIATKEHKVHERRQNRAKEIECWVCTRNLAQNARFLRIARQWTGTFCRG